MRLAGAPRGGVGLSPVGVGLSRWKCRRRIGDDGLGECRLRRVASRETDVVRVRMGGNRVVVYGEKKQYFVFLKK